jgi:hypothetical protein
MVGLVRRAADTSAKGTNASVIAITRRLMLLYAYSSARGSVSSLHVHLLGVVSHHFMYIAATKMAAANAKAESHPAMSNPQKGGGGRDSTHASRLRLAWPSTSAQSGSNVQNDVNSGRRTPSKNATFFVTKEKEKKKEERRKKRKDCDGDENDD